MLLDSQAELSKLAAAGGQDRQGVAAPAEFDDLGIVGAVGGFPPRVSRWKWISA